MKIQLKEANTFKVHQGQILKIGPKEMPLKKDGWRFSWKKLAMVEGAQFYKINRIDSPEIIEGVLMFTLINDEMLYMNNVEVAPHNYGNGGKYENVAGCLISFACMKSFELGRRNYLGFLSFESKTELIEFYQEKYGATWAMGQKMFIDPIAGRRLIGKYLNIKEAENE